MPAAPPPGSVSKPTADAPANSARASSSSRLPPPISRRNAATSGRMTRPTAARALADRATLDTVIPSRVRAACSAVQRSSPATSAFVSAHSTRIRSRRTDEPADLRQRRGLGAQLDVGAVLARGRRDRVQVGARDDAAPSRAAVGRPVADERRQCGERLERGGVARLEADRGDDVARFAERERLDGRGAALGGGRDHGVLDRRAEREQRTVAAAVEHAARTHDVKRHPEPLAVPVEVPRLDVAARRGEHRVLDDAQDLGGHVVDAIRVHLSRLRVRGGLGGQRRCAGRRRAVVALLQIDEAAPRWQGLAEHKRPDRHRRARAAEDDVACELRPRRQRRAHLDHARRHPRREQVGVEELQHDRRSGTRPPRPSALPAGRSTSSEVMPVHAPVQQRAVRLEVEALDVEHAAVARLHDHGQAQLARALAQQDLHGDAVAFVDHDVDRGAELVVAQQEALDVVGRHAVRDDRDPEVGVDLGDLARGEDDLRQPDLVDARTDPVHVGQLETIEVREAQMAADALERERERDRVADRQPDDADRRGSRAAPARPP